jgi:hypothetical protein
VAKAKKAFDSSLVFPDGYFLRIRVWLVPESVAPSEHRFKYSLFYGRLGERVILYDNERGKGDHRHYWEREEGYEFENVETLIADFLADVLKARGGGE